MDTLTVLAGHASVKIQAKLVAVLELIVPVLQYVLAQVIVAVLVLVVDVHLTERYPHYVL